MEYRRFLRLGALLIATAILLRLLSGNALAPLWQALGRPQVVAALLYLETGRVIRTGAMLSYPAESPRPQATEATAPEPEPAPTFSPADLESVQIDNETGYDPDLAALIAAPLEWDLTGDTPKVLILHTHGSESYTPTADDTYTPSGDYRTLDNTRNMVSLGDHLAAQLEAAGIPVLQDRQLHDYPSYNGSYTNARASAQQILADNPQICLILDLHRDAAADSAGAQMDTSAQIRGQESAQLMIVTGSDDGGLEHPAWQQNLSLALQLQALLQSRYPGLCRPVNLCAQRFNTDLRPGALLIEVGAAGNTRAEALAATDALAEGIIALARGANLPAG